MCEYSVHRLIFKAPTYRRSLSALRDVTSMFLEATDQNGLSEPKILRCPRRRVPNLLSRACFLFHQSPPFVLQFTLNSCQSPLLIVNISHSCYCPLSTANATLVQKFAQCTGIPSSTKTREYSKREHAKNNQTT